MTGDDACPGAYSLQNRFLCRHLLPSGPAGRGRAVHGVAVRQAACCAHRPREYDKSRSTTARLFVSASALEFTGRALSDPLIRAPAPPGSGKPLRSIIHRAIPNLEDPNTPHTFRAAGLRTPAKCGLRGAFLPVYFFSCRPSKSRGPDYRSGAEGLPRPAYGKTLAGLRYRAVRTVWRFVRRSRVPAATKNSGRSSPCIICGMGARSTNYYNEFLAKRLRSLRTLRRSNPGPLPSPARRKEPKRQWPPND